jgi:ABC-2 type transport system permease protein
VNWATIRAVFKRDFWSFFGDPTGYVFILFFVLVATALNFQDTFFVQNKANLDLLSDALPWLLALFFIPAVTMASWSTEYRQGTDQLLLTLPAHDYELVLAKYGACVAIWTVALGFTGVCLMAMLSWLGSPDLGLLFATFLGYWLVGAALCAPGMFASSLVRNQTVAFIVGVVLCLLIVVVGHVGGLLPRAGEAMVELGLPRRFGSFARGVVAFEDLIYFEAIVAAGLYGTTFVVGRRHWAGGAVAQSVHGLLRLAAIVVGGLALVLFVQQAGLRMDVTAERLLSLTKESRAVIDGLDENRPVTVEVWTSVDMPAELVPTRDALLRMLDELDARGGDKVRTIVHEVEIFSDEAQRAEQVFAIKPEAVGTKEGGRETSTPVILGLAFTCGARELVIPFFHRGLPVQFELIHAIGSVAERERKAVGIMTGGVNIFGGFDFQNMSRKSEWQVVADLKKQYDVREVDGTAPIDTSLAVLVVPMPTALPQEQLDRLSQFLFDGGKALLLCDPYPAIDMEKAPSRPPGAGRNPFQQQQAPETPRGDAQPLLRAMGVRWESDRISWDAYNPHKWDFPKEVVFLGPGTEDRPSAFNEADPISAGLQEMAFIYPGTLEGQAAGDVKSTVLVRTGPESGWHPWSALVSESFFGLQPLPPDSREYLSRHGASKAGEATGEALAMRVTGHLVAPIDGTGAMKRGATSANAFDAIVVADLDLISDIVYSLRAQAQGGEGDLPELDNIGFIGNCIDALAGKTEYLELRKLRPKHRTLERFERYKAEQAKVQTQAASDAKKVKDDTLSAARKRLDDKLKEIEESTTLDPRTKRVMLTAAQEREQKKLEAETRKVEDEERAQVRKSRATLESKLKEEKNRIRLLAVLLPPLPVLGLALIIFLRKLARERESTPAQRRRRSA